MAKQCKKKKQTKISREGSSLFYFSLERGVLTIKGNGKTPVAADSEQRGCWKHNLQPEAEIARVFRLRTKLKRNGFPSSFKCKSLSDFSIYDIVIVADSEGCNSTFSGSLISINC